MAEDLPRVSPRNRDSEDPSILGFLVAQHLAPEWELENIVVAPTARRKGLGKRLLDALLDAARETNSNSVFLEVRESNARSANSLRKSRVQADRPTRSPTTQIPPKMLSCTA